MTEEHQSWLDQTFEEAIDAEVEICDPHHHLWDRPENRYLLEELHRDTGAGHNVVRTVFVECKRPGRVGQVARRIRKAHRQLEERYNAAPDPRACRGHCLVGALAAGEGE